jgi:hypothetical protein
MYQSSARTSYYDSKHKKNCVRVFAVTANSIMRPCTVWDACTARQHQQLLLLLRLTVVRDRVQGLTRKGAHALVMCPQLLK